MNNTINPSCFSTAGQEIVPVMGGRLQFHLTGKQTAGQAFISTSVYDAGLGVPLHTHQHEDEIFHILEGEVEITIGSETSLAGPGASAFLPRGIPHAWKVTGDRPAKFLLTITPSGMEEMFRELSALPPGEPDMKRIGDICRRYGISFEQN